MSDFDMYDNIEHKIRKVVRLLESLPFDTEEMALFRDYLVYKLGLIRSWLMALSHGYVDHNYECMIKLCKGNKTIRNQLERKLEELENV